MREIEIKFNIKYETRYGECLYMEFEDGVCHAMQWSEGMRWQFEKFFPAATEELRYIYIVKKSDGARLYEAEKHSVMLDASSGGGYEVFDYWQEYRYDRTLGKSAFTFGADTQKRTAFQSSGSLRFTVAAPECAPEHLVAIAGSHPYLGAWDVERALPLISGDFPFQEIDLELHSFTFPLEYKYIVKERATGKLIAWEEGMNRRIESLDTDAGKNVLINDFPARFGKSLKQKLVGTVVPLFSLRSADSFGTGDIYDLKKFIDWIALTGQRLVQLLPLNDTIRTHTWEDSYPYSAISVFALHPLYISAALLWKDEEDVLIDKYINEVAQLEQLSALDYPAVERLKMTYLREYYEMKRDVILNNRDFRRFVKEQASWLLPYAAFSCLREKFQTARYSDWKGFEIYNEHKIKRLVKTSPEAADVVNFYFFLQYELDRQLCEVASYARSKRVILKGDIAIGVNRYSVDTWTEPRLFHLEQQAGAPPDHFSDTGQNWSFPTYNWEEMEKDGYDWWKRRLKHLNRYFDCVRIDHILGFFRIWEIPQSLDGRVENPHSLDRRVENPDSSGQAPHSLYGHFNPALPLSVKEIEAYGLNFRGAVKQLFVSDPYNPHRRHPYISPQKMSAYSKLNESEQAAFARLRHDYFFVRHNEFWKQTALKRLKPLIESTKMLICGEDLGMMPASVHEVMDELQIFTLELGRLSKQYGVEFTDLNAIPERSVCTTSTHDMEPLREWWKEDPVRAHRYCAEMFHGESVFMPECEPETAKQIVTRHVKASSMLTVIPVQDWLATTRYTKTVHPEEERINVPSNPNNHWCYRMQDQIELLLTYCDLTEYIRSICAR